MEQKRFKNMKLGEEWYVSNHPVVKNVSKSKKALVTVKETRLMPLKINLLPCTGAIGKVPDHQRFRQSWRLAVWF